MSRSDDDARSAPTCAVCYDDVDDASLARLPCCGARARASTTQFCAKCVEILIQTGDGVAACPRCRAAIARVDGAFVAAPLRRCAVCRQARATGETCEACALGGRAALRYRCERCGGAQRIPHPMWRYMASPTSLSSATWACHGACGDYTRWRIDSRDAASVPASDAPASWGSSEAWLAAAREAVERARASEARLEGARTTRVGDGVKAAVMVALWAAAAATRGRRRRPSFRRRRSRRRRRRVARCDARFLDRSARRWGAPTLVERTPPRDDSGRCARGRWPTRDA